MKGGSTATTHLGKDELGVASAVRTVVAAGAFRLVADLLEDPAERAGGTEESRHASGAQLPSPHRDPTEPRGGTITPSGSPAALGTRKRQKRPAGLLGCLLACPPGRDSLHCVPGETRADTPRQKAPKTPADPMARTTMRALSEQGHDRRNIDTAEKKTARFVRPPPYFSALLSLEFFYFLPFFSRAGRRMFQVRVTSDWLVKIFIPNPNKLSSYAQDTHPKQIAQTP